MSIFSRKICLLGDFAVGKTSSVARFVRNTFSDSYLTTIGVKVDTKTLLLDAEHIMRLVIWDIAGANVLDQTRTNYVRGTHGLMLIADGTRSSSLASALDLWHQACETCGAELPTVLMLNKFDLADRWEISPEIVTLIGRMLPTFTVSAKTGTSLEEAFNSLARKMVP